MGVRVFEQILKGCSTLRPVQKLILLALAVSANYEGCASVDLVKLAFYVGCSKDTATAALKSLTEQAWIIVQSRATNSRPAVYHINLDRVLRRGEYA